MCKYQVLSGRGETPYDAVELVEQDVNMLLMGGWRPQGGIQIVIERSETKDGVRTCDDRFGAFQAMILED